MFTKNGPIGAKPLEVKIALSGRLLAIASSLAVIIVMLQKWIHLTVVDRFNDFLPFLPGPTQKMQAQYSLFHASQAMDSINRYILLDDLKTASLVLKVVVVLIIAAQTLLIVSLLINLKSSKHIAGVTTGATCLISFAFFIGIHIINSSVAEESYGLITSALAPTAMPYLAILFSLVGGASTYLIFKTGH